MNYSQFLSMGPEVSLIALLVIVFLYDLITTGKESRKAFHPIVCALMIIHILLNAIPQQPVSAFGGMYQTMTVTGVMKTILAVGTLIVLFQSGQWLQRPDTKFKEGEFYELLISTLLGMNVMMSSAHFLIFFLGLEMASIPMACLIGLD